jgi:hypothetical protein
MEIINLTLFLTNGNHVNTKDTQLEKRYQLQISYLSSALKLFLL